MIIANHFRKKGKWGVFSGLHPPKTPHFRPFIKMIHGNAFRNGEKTRGGYIDK
jgi:hypothetical protein